MMPRGLKEKEPFERYYFKKVAISEGCNCAELVIRRETEGSALGRLIGFALGGLLRLSRRAAGSR